MGVLDFSYIKAVGVKWPGLKKIFLIFSDTLVGNLGITPKKAFFRGGASIRHYFFLL